jgi:hypothetical protein
VETVGQTFLSVRVELIQAWQTEEIFHSSFSISHLSFPNEDSGAQAQAGPLLNGK